MPSKCTTDCPGYMYDYCAPSGCSFPWPASDSTLLYYCAELDCAYLIGCSC